MYDNIIESYVEDIYTGVIEDYTIATVKVSFKISHRRQKEFLQFSVDWLVRLRLCIDREGSYLEPFLGRRCRAELRGH